MSEKLPGKIKDGRRVVPCVIWLPLETHTKMRRHCEKVDRTQNDFLIAAVNLAVGRAGKSHKKAVPTEATA
jgi:hypothetical protein